MCFIPLRDRKSSNSILEKLGPLSVTMSDGRPNSAKMRRRDEMIADEVVEDNILASNHLEWASTKIKNMCPRNGPARSKCNLDQGVDGQLQGRIGAAGGAGR